LAARRNAWRISATARLEPSGSCSSLRARSSAVSGAAHTEARRRKLLHHVEQHDEPSLRTEYDAGIGAALRGIAQDRKRLRRRPPQQLIRRLASDLGGQPRRLMPIDLARRKQALDGHFPGFQLLDHCKAEVNTENVYARHLRPLKFELACRKN